MLLALLSVIGCQLIGELIREATDLPIPGPVIGLFVLVGVVSVRARKLGAASPPDLEQTSARLIGLMGLLFVPAGVGVITEGGLLRREWLPILAAVLISTILSLVVTGLVMHWTTRSSSTVEPVSSRRHNEGDVS
jgi:holin-like protein